MNISVVIFVSCVHEEVEQKKNTTSKRLNLTLRRELRSNPEGVAEAIMVHSLECIAACSTWFGVGCTRQHKGSTHIEVAQLVCAGTALCPSHEAKICHNQEDQQSKLTP